ncbi:hypothetical protein LEP1GSC166_0153 [Leptospira kirschneri]|nr:hypothetical protein LEP1GSC166_0153 [Leptospira kirschneri]
MLSVSIHSPFKEEKERYDVWKQIRLQWVSIHSPFKEEKERFIIILMTEIILFQSTLLLKKRKNISTSVRRGPG